jgi:hypothetical protein
MALSVENGKRTVREPVPRANGKRTGPIPQIKNQNPKMMGTRAQAHSRSFSLCSFNYVSLGGGGVFRGRCNLKKEKQIKKTKREEKAHTPSAPAMYSTTSGPLNTSVKLLIPERAPTTHGYHHEPANAYSQRDVPLGLGSGVWMRRCESA